MKDTRLKDWLNYGGSKLDAGGNPTTRGYYWFKSHNVAIPVPLQDRQAYGAYQCVIRQFSTGGYSMFRCPCPEHPEGVWFGPARSFAQAQVECAEHCRDSHQRIGEIVQSNWPVLA